MPRKPAKKRSDPAAKPKPRKSSRPKKTSIRRTSDSKQRLQRLLASAGFGSRRQCEELIEAGRVEVDGTVVTRLGTTVDPNVNKVRVDGAVLKKQKLVYYAVNKPIGFVTTNRDPHGRPRVVDLVPPDERVFAVGRLDRNSEGLILLTNDGELAQKLTHPKFGVRKVYRVTVAGKVDFETMKQMRKGIYIAEGLVRVDGAKLLKSRSRSTEMEIVLREGKNREIRRILARLGHKVQHLRRIAVGPLRLGDVPSGAYRVVSRQEVEKLWRETETAAETGPKGRGKKFAGKRTTTKTNRRPSKKRSTRQRESGPDQASGSFNYEQPVTRGSVIGSESEKPASETPTRRRKSTKGKRKSASTKKRSSSRGASGGRKKSRAPAGKAGRGQRNQAKRKRKK